LHHVSLCRLPRGTPPMAPHSFQASFIYCWNNAISQPFGNGKPSTHKKMWFGGLFF
jgi:hypothetical protein